MESLRNYGQNYGDSEEKSSQRKKKCKKAKWWSEEVLQIAEERKELKGKGERKRYMPLNAEF